MVNERRMGGEILSLAVLQNKKTALTEQTA